MQGYGTILTSAGPLLFRHFRCHIAVCDATQRDTAVTTMAHPVAPHSIQLEDLDDDNEDHRAVQGQNGGGERLLLLYFQVLSPCLLGTLLLVLLAVFLDPGLNSAARDSNVGNDRPALTSGGPTYSRRVGGVADGDDDQGVLLPTGPGAWADVAAGAIAQAAANATAAATALRGSGREHGGPGGGGATTSIAVALVAVGYFAAVIGFMAVTLHIHRHLHSTMAASSQQWYRRGSVGVARSSHSSRGGAGDTNARSIELQISDDDKSTAGDSSIDVIVVIDLDAERAASDETAAGLS